MTRWTFVGKVMSLLFNMLSRLVITFLPGSKRLLIWLQSPVVSFKSAVGLPLGLAVLVGGQRGAQGGFRGLRLMRISGSEPVALLSPPGLPTASRRAGGTNSEFWSQGGSLACQARTQQGS